MYLPPLFSDVSLYLKLDLRVNIIVPREMSSGCASLQRRYLDTAYQDTIQKQGHALDLTLHLHNKNSEYTL